MNKSFKNLKLSRRLALFAGITYCSWPLGYLLNPAVNRRGLASELGAYGQPYNWLFILADVVSGLLALASAVLLWRSLRVERKKRWVRGAIINFGLFGFFTAIDAALPLACTPSIQECPSIANDPLLLLHGIASVSAAVCLGMCAVVLARSGKNPRRVVAAALVIFMSFLLGVVSVVFFFISGPGALAQHVFIVIYSIWIVFVPVVLLRLLNHHKFTAEHNHL